MWIAVGGAACAAGCANGEDWFADSVTACRRHAVSAFELRSAQRAPDDLSVDVTGNTVSLSWSRVRDAVDYVVLVGMDSDQLRNGADQHE